MNSAYEIVNSLPKGVWAPTAQRGKACCPAHDDNEPSLVVKQEGNKVLWYCHAGCSQEAVRDALIRLGLWQTKTSDAIAPKNPKAPRKAVAAKKPKLPRKKVAERKTEDQKYMGAYIIFYAALGYRFYKDGRTTKNQKTKVKEYLANRGITADVLGDIYELPRSKLKKYKFRWAGSAMVAPMTASSALCGYSKDWFTGVHVTRLAWDCRSKADNDARRMRGKPKGSVVPFGDPRGDTLLIAEGIETAMSVYQATGEPTWSALSANNMNAISIPRWVKEVMVCADNDEAGLKAAKALAERVAAMGKIARLAIPEKEGDDWNNVLRDRGAEYCRDRILIAEVIQPPARDGLRAVSAGELFEMEFPPRINLLDPWLPRQGLAMIHAPRGVGKTWVGLGIACAVATGRPFLDWNPQTKGEVLYIDGELPASILRDRLREYQAAFGADVDGSIRLVTPDLQDGGMPNLSEPAGQAEVDKLVRPETVLIIIDSISTLCRSGIENDAESWTANQEWALRHRAQGLTILFIHHSGKSGKQRGTSRREDVLDTVICLSRPDGITAEDGAVFEITFEKSRGFYGADAAPKRATIGVEDGCVVWTVGSTDGPDQRLQKIAGLVQSGIPQVEIAEQLGLTKGRVSQLVKQAREQGLLEADDEQSE